MESLQSLQNISPVPIATGQRLYPRWQFQDIIAKSAVQLVQPDIITSGESSCCDVKSRYQHSKWSYDVSLLFSAGGIWELRKIAAQAEAREIGLAPCVLSRAVPAGRSATTPA